MLAQYQKVPLLNCKVEFSTFMSWHRRHVRMQFESENKLNTLVNLKSENKLNTRESQTTNNSFSDIAVELYIQTYITSYTIFANELCPFENTLIAVMQDVLSYIVLCSTHFLHSDVQTLTNNTI